MRKPESSITSIDDYIEASHIGFYPTPSGIEAFKDELDGYKSSKGAVQFPLDQPLPIDLVSRMVAFRADENLRKAARKGEKS